MVVLLGSHDRDEIATKATGFDSEIKNEYEIGFRTFRIKISEV